MAKATKDSTASFLNILDNDDVIEKLGKALSVSIQLTIDEFMKPIHKKLDQILADNKVTMERLSNVEKENAKLKQLNDGLHATVAGLQSRLEQLEQSQLQYDVIINGIKETYAERADGSNTDGTPPANSREDTIATACSLFKETCGVSVTPSDIHAAYRLPTKVPGRRPMLVTFNTRSLRTAVIKARRPKQTQ